MTKLCGGLVKGFYLFIKVLSAKTHTHLPRLQSFIINIIIIIINKCIENKAEIT